MLSGSFHLTHQKLVTFSGGSENGPPRNHVPTGAWRGFSARSRQEPGAAVSPEVAKPRPQWEAEAGSAAEPLGRGVGLRVHVWGSSVPQLGALSHPFFGWEASPRLQRKGLEDSGESPKTLGVKARQAPPKGGSSNLLLGGLLVKLDASILKEVFKT